MNILTVLAQSLDRFLTKAVGLTNPTDAYTAFADVFNAKVSIFNGCTGALFASIALGFFGILSLRKSIFLGACSLLGRHVADESFKVVPKQVKDLIPKNIQKAGKAFLNALPENAQVFISSTAGDILKPVPALHLNEVVIFYSVITRVIKD